MKNYVATKNAIGEGLGGMMGEYANLYVFHLITGFTPAYLQDNDFFIFNIFNKNKKNVFEILDCFPNLKNTFDSITYSEHEWGEIDIGNRPLEIGCFQALKAFKKNPNVNICLKTFKMYHQWYEKRKQVYDLFKFDDNLLNIASKNIPETKNQIVGVSLRMQYKIEPMIKGTKFEHISLSFEYYKEAFSKFDKNKCIFLIFSDFIVEAAELLEPLEKEYDIVYTNYSLSSAEAMASLSLCDHFINSNSSFSTWGSLLSKNKDKKIICAKKFLHEESPASKILNGNWFPPDFTPIDLI